MSTGEERTYTTDLDLQAGAIHLTLTDAEMVAWIEANVNGPLTAELFRLMEQHGAQQVLIACGIASCVDLWRREHPERWEAAIAKAKGPDR